MQIRNFQLQAFGKPPVWDQQLLYTRQLFLSVVNLTTNTPTCAVPVQRVSDSGFRPNPNGVLAAAGFSGNTALVISELTFCSPVAVALTWKHGAGMEPECCSFHLKTRSPLSCWGVVSYLHPQLTGFCAGNFDRYPFLACFVAHPASASTEAEQHLHFAAHHCPALHSHAGSLHIELMFPGLKEGQGETPEW